MNTLSIKKLDLITILCIFILSFFALPYAIAKNNLLEMSQMMSKLDDHTAAFLLSLMVQKEQLIENDQYFDKAKELLPITYENYQLKEMNKSDHELMLVFDTKDQKVPELWKANQDQFKLKFFKGVCKGFKKYNFKKIDEVTISVEVEGKPLTTLNQKKSSCGEILK